MARRLESMDSLATSKRRTSPSWTQSPLVFWFRWFWYVKTPPGASEKWKRISCCATMAFVAPPSPSLEPPPPPTSSLSPGAASAAATTRIVPHRLSSFLDPELGGFGTRVTNPLAPLASMVRKTTLPSGRQLICRALILTLLMLMLLWLLLFDRLLPSLSLPLWLLLLLPCRLSASVTTRKRTSCPFFSSKSLPPPPSSSSRMSDVSLLSPVPLPSPSLWVEGS
mmetsp:Transcript_31206/g.65434  ORF Transcript_31206/g.65434 Transcript_31206/m.65434 type:complete len:224 (-) Transcript_31206:111-782(-)